MLNRISSRPSTNAAALDSARANPKGCLERRTGFANEHRFSVFICGKATSSLFPGLDGPIARCSRFGSVACEGNQFASGDAGRRYDKLHLRVLFVRRTKHHSVGWDALEVSWFQVAHYDAVFAEEILLKSLISKTK